MKKFALVLVFSLAFLPTSAHARSVGGANPRPEANSVGGANPRPEDDSVGGANPRPEAMPDWAIMLTTLLQMM